MATRIDGAYEIVREAYVRWAQSRDETGWVLGDTWCKAADTSRAADLLALARIDDPGMGRVKAPGSSIGVGASGARFCCEGDP